MPLPETLPRGVRRSSNSNSSKTKRGYGSSVANSTSVGTNDDMASYLLSVGGHSKNNSKRRSRSNFSSNVSTNSSTDSTAVTVVTGTVGASSVTQYSVATTEVEDDESRCLYFLADKYGYDKNEQRQPEEEGISGFQGDDDDDGDNDDNISKSSDSDSVSSCDDGTTESLTELSAIIDPRKIAQEQQSHQRQGQQKSSILDRLSQSPRQIAEVSTVDQEQQSSTKQEQRKSDPPILPEERIEVWIDGSFNESQNRNGRKTKKDTRADKLGGRKKSLIEFFSRTTKKKISSAAIFSKANNDQGVETTNELDDDSHRERERENYDTSQMYDLEDENSIVASQCTVSSEEEQNQLPITSTQITQVMEEEEEEEKDESQSTSGHQQESVDEKPRKMYKEDVDADHHLSDVEIAATTKGKNCFDGSSWLLPISCCIDDATTIPEEEMVFVKSTSTNEPMVDPMKPQSILKSHNGSHCDTKTVETKNDDEKDESKSIIPSTLPIPVVSRVVPRPYATRKQEKQRRRMLAMFDDKSPPGQVEKLCNKIESDVNSCETPTRRHRKNKKNGNQTFGKNVNIFKRLPSLLPQQRNEYTTNDTDERNGEGTLWDRSFDDKEAKRSSNMNPPSAQMVPSKSKTNGKADNGADWGRSTSSRTTVTTVRRRRSVSPFRRRCSKDKDLQGMVNAYKAERIANQISNRRSSSRLSRLVSQEQLNGGVNYDRRVMKKSRNKEKRKQIPPNHAVNQLPGAPERNGHQKSTDHCNDWGIFTGNCK